MISLNVILHLNNHLILLNFLVFLLYIILPKSIQGTVISIIKRIKNYMKYWKPPSPE